VVTTMPSGSSLAVAHPILGDAYFRPSKYEFPLNLIENGTMVPRTAIGPFVRNQDGARSGPSTVQTPIFKNSHYNTAHFRNPDFEPEQYRPSMDSDRPRKRHSHWIWTSWFLSDCGCEAAVDPLHGFQIILSTFWLHDNWTRILDRFTIYELTTWTVKSNSTVKTLRILFS